MQGVVSLTALDLENIRVGAQGSAIKNPDIGRVAEVAAESDGVLVAAGSTVQRGVLGEVADGKFIVRRAAIEDKAFKNTDSCFCLCHLYRGSPVLVCHCLGIGNRQLSIA